MSWYATTRPSSPATPNWQSSSWPSGGTRSTEWAVHASEALKAGLPDALVEAIRTGAAPVFAEPADRVVYEFASAVATDGRVTDEQYRSAILDLGERAVVELVALLGYYTMVAFTLNVFEIPAPGGGRPLD